MARPRKTGTPLTQTAFRLTEEELEQFRQVAASRGVSVGQFLRSAGTAVAGNEELLEQALRNQEIRDASVAGVARVIGNPLSR